MTNKFDSDFERIERAFRKQREITASEDAKRAAIAQARNAFEEEKKLHGLQGSAAGTRLNQQTGKKQTLFDWRQMMNKLNSKFTYSLMGGASVAVLAMLVIAPDLLREQRFSDPRQGNTASETPVAVPEKPVQDEIAEALPVQEEDAGAANDVVVPAPSPVTEPVLQSGQQAVPAMKKREARALADQARQAQQLNSVAGKIARPEGYSRIAPVPDMPYPAPADQLQQTNDTFEAVEANRLKAVADEPVSTFSADVDTASYAFMRSSLNNGVLPPPDSIRVEELVNYFDYDYAVPEDRMEPFRASVEIMPTPWNEGTKLMSIGIKGYQLSADEKPSSNLVFLIDTSGSMNQVNKLPLLRNSFKLLLDSLKPDDTVSIVAYAGSAGTVLEPTKAGERAKILDALDRLAAGGSTAGAEGIRQAYALAERKFDKDGVNRVILATDGDFNVGINDPEALKDYIARKRDSGIGLSVLGFGRGNYNDHLMQKLAQNGNGNASYIDTLSEARKVLVEEAGSTLFTIAKDVKLQVEFNPALVSEYRLIGYETRALNREDFNNDKVDAGDIGAGHTVTAIYEITPAGSSAQRIEPLRYGDNDDNRQVEAGTGSSEYAFLKIRYKLPEEDESRLITRAITGQDEASSVSAASENARFAASVAGFGQLLKGSVHLGDLSHDELVKLALGAKGEDPFGYRSEFINLVRLAESIDKLR